MKLTKITDLTTQLGLSSRTLRYYEQIGLIKSVRPQFEKYRFFNEREVERLRQIKVLRKMQIPIKDIIRIYESEDMSALVSVFVDKIHEIDSEVTALSELKDVINNFLQRMTESGIKKISALPLLYEEMDKQLELIGERKAVTYEDLDHISARLSKPVEPGIVSLPAMRVLSSLLKDGNGKTNSAGFWRFVQTHDLLHDDAGRHERFEYQTEDGDVVVLYIPHDYENNSAYSDFIFEGGLFACINVYVDEDLGECFRTLVKCFDDNKFYEIDYRYDGNLRHPAMLESLISADERRELVSLYVPVKKRIADPNLFKKPIELQPETISISEIEEQNPALWTVDVDLTKLTPINGPHYKILENGEVEYTGWISSRVLGTNVQVKLPYRVDIEFRLAGDDERYGYGDSEGSVIMYHGEDMGYYAGGYMAQTGFGVNMGNRAITDNADVLNNTMRPEALSFRQPVFRDLYKFDGRGKINRTGYNQITWIIGAKHLAAIVNGEIRYCGTDFPYMSLDLNREKVRNIVIGSNGQGMKYFRSIRVSQLAYTPKSKIRKEELAVITKRSNNIIPNIHRLITDEHGENYWFNGSARYVMECLGENEYDYQFFAGLTGDVFTQHYKFNFAGDGVNACHQHYSDTKFFEDVFAKCGYASTFVLARDLCKNKEMYVQTLISYIDKGVAVISMGHGGPPFGVFVGYEEHGKTLLYIKGNNNEPEHISIDKAMESEFPDESGWMFVGEKNGNPSLADIYREAIYALPKLLTTNDKKYCFGVAAFRAWANDIESGVFDNIKPEGFDQWAMYTNFVCVLATNGSCCHGFLERAQNLNPDMKFLTEVGRLYKRTAEIWNNDNGDDLEALGGGFNVTLEVLQDKEHRSKIVAKIRECAEVVDEIVRVLNKELK